MLLLLAWVPLLWQPVRGQSPGVGVKKTVVEPPDGRKGSDPKKWADERGSKERPFIVDTEGHQQSDTERTQSDTKEQRAREVERWTLYFAQLGAWATAALVVIGLGGVVAAIVTLLAIKRQAELQERAIRPWICTDFIKNGIVTIEQGRITIYTESISLKNTGPSIAMDGLMLAHLISSRTGELQQGIEDAWEVTRKQLANRSLQEWESGFVLHPTRSHDHPISMGTSMALAELKAGICYVLVCIMYRDQFKRNHITQDCFRVVWMLPDGVDETLTGIVPVRFDVVPAHQSAD